MGYVALLIVAYEQYRSPWAISLALVAYLLPQALLGTFFGRLADRHSRRVLAVTADVLRVVVFVGLAVAGEFAVTLVLSAVAGVGTSLFAPASKAAIPALAGEQADEAVGVSVTLWSAATLAGPALGAGLLLFAPVETLLLLNAASFAISAVTLLGLPLDGPAVASIPDDHEQRDAIAAGHDHPIQGLRAIRQVPGLSLVIATTAGMTLALGLVNVAEPLLATGPLDAGAAGFSLLVAVFGVGATIGATQGRASLSRLLTAVLASAIVMVLIALAPTIAVAAVLFTASGWCEGLSISSEQRLITAIAPERILGSTFGFKDALDSGALLVAYLASAALAQATGPRTVFAVSGVLVGLVGLAALAVHTAQERAAAAPEKNFHA